MSVISKFTASPHGVANVAERKLKRESACRVNLRISRPCENCGFGVSRLALGESSSVGKRSSVRMALVGERLACGRDVAEPSGVLGYDLVQGANVRWSSVTDKSMPDPPIAVLLHGILGSRKNWGTFCRRLAQAFPTWQVPTWRKLTCKAAEVSVTEEESASGGNSGGENWVPVVPLAALPKGERRVIIQNGETILLLWYKDEVFAIENRSPAEGAYSEGLLNAKLTQEGCIVCPTTDSTFDLRTGAIKEWYPKNPVLRVLTPALRTLFVYPVKTDEQNIYIDMGGSASSAASAEIIFSGKAQPGVTATDVNVEEVRMVVDEDAVGFGFTGKNELINGKAAVIGFLLLLDFELLTGKGVLKGTGFLDFIYSISKALK